MFRLSERGNRMKKAPLVLLFSGILLAMVVVTTVASLDRSVLAAGRDLWPDPWFIATLCDAYFGFVTFYVWVFYKEQSVLARFAWFVLIMTLGNLAMAAYVLIQLFKLGPGDSWPALLLRKGEA